MSAQEVCKLPAHTCTTSRTCLVVTWIGCCVIALMTAVSFTQMTSIGMGSDPINLAVARWRQADASVGRYWESLPWTAAITGQHPNEPKPEPILAPLARPKLRTPNDPFLSSLLAVIDEIIDGNVTADHAREAYTAALSQMESSGGYIPMDNPFSSIVYTGPEETSATAPADADGNTPLPIASIDSLMPAQHLTAEAGATPEQQSSELTLDLEASTIAAQQQPFLADVINTVDAKGSLPAAAQTRRAIDARHLNQFQAQAASWQLLTMALEYLAATERLLLCQNEDPTLPFSITATSGRYLLAADLSSCEHMMPNFILQLIWVCITC